MGACSIIPIQYGPLRLEGVATQSTARISPMLADDGFSIKYYKVELTTELIYAAPTNFADTNGINSADEWFDQVRRTLTTRGLPLRFNYRGFGKVIESDISATNTDPTFGPHPKIINWQPLGANKAIQVSWAVEFTTSRCPIEVPNFSSLSREQFKILSLVEDSVLNYDEDGAVTVRTNGTMELAAGSQFHTRDAIKRFMTQFLPQALPLYMFQRKLSVNLRKDQRTIDYTVTDTEIKSDNAYFPYMIEQEGTHELTSSLMSQNVSQGSGFTSWANSLDCSFQVRPGVWKGWAWVAFALILANRRNRASTSLALFGQGVGGVGNGKEKVDGNDNPAAVDREVNRVARKRIKPMQYPLTLTVKESLYSRNVDISVKWVTTCSLFDLFASTGMFYPVHSKWQNQPFPAQPSDEVWNDIAESNEGQWWLWKQQVVNLTRGDGYRNLSLPKFDLIFDACDSLNSQGNLANQRQGLYYNKNYSDFLVNPSRTSERTALPLGRGSYDGELKGTDIRPGDNQGKSFSPPDTDYMRWLKPEQSWMKYNQKAEFIEETNASYVPSLEEREVSTLQTSNAQFTHSNRIGFKVNGKNTPPDQSVSSPWNDDIVQVRGKPIYKIRVRGYALRLGYQIPAPVVMSVRMGTATVQAYKVGQQRWEHYPVNTSDEVPVFLAKWDLQYAVPNELTGDDIHLNTSGNPAEFA